MFQGELSDLLQQRAKYAYGLQQVRSAASGRQAVSAAGTPRQHAGRVSAAAAAPDAGTDLKQLLQEALNDPFTQNRPSIKPEDAVSANKIQGLQTSKLPSPGAADQGQAGLHHL